MKDFWKFFFIQVLAYGLVDADYRWIAQGNVPLGVSAGMLYAMIAFRVFKSIAESDSRGAEAGYVVGGGVGIWLGIVVSKAVTGV